MAVVKLCTPCLPAANPAVSLDDNSGICRGCGERDGNLADAVIADGLLARGWWATNTGTIRGPNTH